MNVSSISTDTTYTLSQFIALKDSDQITYRNYSILQQSLTDPSIVYSMDNIIYQYMDELKQYRKLVMVSDIDRLKYAFKPKLLAYDIYGSTEMYFILLAINGMCNVKEFTLEDKTFWGIAPNDLNTLLNNIYRAEAEHLSINRANLGITES